MDDEVLAELRSRATRNNATLVEVVDFSMSSDGSSVIMEAKDERGAVRLLIPSTQLPPLAASFLRAWVESMQRNEQAMLATDGPALAAVMFNTPAQAERAKAFKLDDGMVRVVFDVSGSPFCLEINEGAAQALGKQLLSEIQRFKRDVDRQQ